MIITSKQHGLLLGTFYELAEYIIDNYDTRIDEYELTSWEANTPYGKMHMVEEGDVITIKIKTERYTKVYTKLPSGIIQFYMS